MPALHSSSSISDEDGREVANTFDGEFSFIHRIDLIQWVAYQFSSGSIAITAAESVRNVRLREFFPPSSVLITQQFLDEITLALSPSPSIVIGTPPAVLTIPRNLWEELVDACYPEEPLFWDYNSQASPRTPAYLDDEVIDGHEGVGNGSFPILTLDLCIYLLDHVRHRCRRASPPCMNDRC